MQRTIFKLLFLIALFEVMYGAVTLSEVTAEGCSTRYVTVCVTEGSRFIHDLGMDDFSFEENREPLNPPYIEILNECPSESLMVDIVLFLDLSTSMDEKIVELRENIPAFVAGIEMMDYRIAMVIFNGCHEEVTFPEEGVLEEIRVDFSSSPACSTYSGTGPDIWAVNMDEYTCLFTAAWNEFYERPTSGRGSGDEDQYGAIADMADFFTFREDARRVFILFTDERPIYSDACAPSWGHSTSDLLDFIGHMLPYDIDIFTITPVNGSFYGSGDARYYTGYPVLSDETGGSWFDLESPDYSELVDDITARIGVDSCCYSFMFTDTFFCWGTNFIEVEVPGHGTGDAYYQSQCPPTGYWILPQPYECGGWTSCPEQNFDLLLFSDLEFGIAGLEVEVDGEIFDLSSPELSLVSGEELLFTPSAAWENGQTVVFDFLWGVDDSGCHFDAPSCSFMVDIEPPVYSYFTPDNGEIVIEAEPRIYFTVFDSLTGVNWGEFDTSDVKVRVNGAEVDGYYLVIEGDTVEVRGLSFVDGDSITVIGEFHDTPDFEYCPSNMSTIEWSFIVVINRPIAWLISPYPGTITACVDQNIRMGIWDSNGIAWETVEVNIAGTRFTIDHPWLRNSADTLIFSPDSGFYPDNSMITVDLIQADDIYGMPLSTPLHWVFYTDFTPPSIDLENPPPDEMLYYRQPDLEFFLYDSMSGVDQSTIRITILDQVYLPGQFFYDPTEDELGGSVSLTLDENIVAIFPGDTMIVSIHVCDKPDSCAPNCADMDFRIPVEPVAYCSRRPNPFTPNGDGYNDIVQFHYPFMFSEDATLSIFDKRKELVRSIDIDISTDWTLVPSFDGFDKEGKKLPPGLYLYIITRDKEIICEGTLTLVR